MPTAPYTHRRSGRASVAPRHVTASAAVCLALAATTLPAQTPPDRVLVRTHDAGPDGRLPVDRGAARLWLELQKVRTTGSVLYTTGHPDDEESGVLTLLSRGMGVRTALLTLNRGEGGANAIGPELFDELGLIRTEELRLAGRYYGLDDQYFTTAADYGFSKTLDEAMRSWDRDAVLGDMVRVIRTNRPLVVISRWYGSERDGHGHHQAAGALTPAAVEAAADPTRYPEQIEREGLRPWRVRLLYRGRLLGDEPHDVALDPHTRDPWLGESYQAFGAYGLSLQRSQTAGRQRGAGPRTPARYQRLSPEGGTDSSLFGSLDLTLTGIESLTGESWPDRARQAVDLAQRRIEDATAAFDPNHPSVTLGPLSEALTALRSARSAVERAPESDFLLAIEERQLADALATAAGVEVSAVATPRDAPADALMGPAVPGQALDVHVSVDTTPGVRLVDVRLVSRAGWSVSGTVGADDRSRVERLERVLRLSIPADAEPTRPWFTRPDIRSNQYSVRDSAEIGLGEARPGAEVVASFQSEHSESASFDVRVPVVTRGSDAPYGVVAQPLEVAPALSVQVTPEVVVRPSDGRFDVGVDVTSNAPEPISVDVALELPAGWRATPARRTLAFTESGQAAASTFVVQAPDGPAGPDPVVIGATASASGRSYREGHGVIAHRDLRTRRLYRDAVVTVHAIDVAVAPDLRVGYVMGVGDDVPAAIEQLGAEVALLDGDALARGDLGAFDAIVVGTRAYAVRSDLIAANERLLDYARSGGNLVVLYQTPEYAPESQAPFPASLPGNAEEVSEEDAAVSILAPGHPLLATPNRIGPADFEGWVEQRGSKFFAEWASEYTPLVETHDTGQSRQEGVWLSADVGSGHFTYIALALHRQVPYGVHGAFRILANLISAGRQ